MDKFKFPSIFPRVLDDHVLITLVLYTYSLNPTVNIDQFRTNTVKYLKLNHEYNELTLINVLYNPLPVVDVTGVMYDNYPVSNSIWVRFVSLPSNIIGKFDKQISNAKANTIATIADSMYDYVEGDKAKYKKAQKTNTKRHVSKTWDVNTYTTFIL